MITGSGITKSLYFIDWLLSITRFLIEELNMQCPHCRSLMNIYQKATTEKSEVSFYKCTVCVAEYVSSSILSRSQLDEMPDSKYNLYGNSSHHTNPTTLA